ncbi:TRAP transporter substrate-binding protein DctP [uncultured Marinobacter sp.]|uniref:TRAP transporter substrate-binding protein DctP n=1 Tax=uncultured Marinobacter sp. TaxID=187379 RepID=UPI002633D506|nr:TRAP transporter substrate-binding protein DctP [uncultured Marinobacter sp.]
MLPVFLKRLAVLAAAFTFAFSPLVAQAADHTLRLSTLFRPGSDGGQAAEQFAKEVNRRSNGRVEVKVFPASQLGDWVETHSQLMQGAIDIGLQPLSTNFDRRLSIAWFPYIAPTYSEAQTVFSADGFAYKLVDDMIAPQGLRLLGVYSAGMGGAGFAKPVPNPADVEGERGLRVRVWPGGTTHRSLMEGFGYQVTTVPWAELYTAMQTGVVDGQIGGTAEMALDNFKDITNTWVQYNDHLELAWFVINAERMGALPEQYQKIILEVAQEISHKRFDDVREADRRFLDVMEEAGINVVRFEEETLQKLADFTRKEVWPKIGAELDAEVMKRLNQAVGL